MAPLRNRLTRAFGLVCGTAMAAMLGWILLDPGVDRSLASRSTAATVFSFGIWFIWRVAAYPKVVVTTDGVVVHNPFRRHVIPWPIIDAFVVDTRGLHLSLTGGTAVYAWAFSGSLAGALSGNRRAHEVTRTLERARPNTTTPDAVRRDDRFDLGLRFLFAGWAVALGAAVVTWFLDPTAPPIGVMYR